MNVLERLLRYKIAVFEEVSLPSGRDVTTGDKILIRRCLKECGAQQFKNGSTFTAVDLIRILTYTVGYGAEDGEIFDYSTIGEDVDTAIEEMAKHDYLYIFFDGLNIDGNIIGNEVFTYMKLVEGDEGLDDPDLLLDCLHNDTGNQDFACLGRLVMTKLTRKE